MVRVLSRGRPLREGADRNNDCDTCDPRAPKSPSTRGRGSKPLPWEPLPPWPRVALYARARIETMPEQTDPNIIPVALYARARIETALPPPCPHTWACRPLREGADRNASVASCAGGCGVALYARARIETSSIPAARPAHWGRPLREGADRNASVASCAGGCGVALYARARIETRYAGTGRRP